MSDDESGVTKVGSMAGPRWRGSDPVIYRELQTQEVEQHHSCGIQRSNVL